MSVKNNIEPFTINALEHFRTKVARLLREDLGIEQLVSVSFTEEAISLLARDRTYAWSKIASNLEANGIRSQWNTILGQVRSVFIAKWVARWLVGNIVDLLCGDGRIGECISRHGLQVTLTERESPYSGDRHQHEVPFISLDEIMGLLPTHRFDTVLLCTVLHHEINPEFLLSLAARLARRRIIIVENCIEPNYPADYQLLMDLFFNHCLNQTNLLSPANHKSLEGWLSSTYGFGSIYKIERKTSVPGIPLAHHLIVIDSV